MLSCLAQYFSLVESILFKPDIIRFFVCRSSHLHLLLSLLQSEIKLELTYKRPHKNDVEECRIDLEDEEIDPSDINGVVLSNIFRDVPLGAAPNIAKSHVSSSSNSRTETKHGHSGSEERAEITDCLGEKEYVKYIFCLSCLYMIDMLGSFLIVLNLCGLSCHKPRQLQ